MTREIIDRRGPQHHPPKAPQNPEQPQKLENSKPTEAPPLEPDPKEPGTGQ